MLLFNLNYCQVEQIRTSLFKNLHRLNDSIYRSDQPDSLDISLLKELGIKSILNLRNSHHDTVFIGLHHDFNLYHIPMKAYYITNKRIVEAMQVLLSAPKPILIHCKHGSDRTGAVVGMYRILYNGYSKKEALKEMKRKEYGFHRVFINIPIFIKTRNIEKLKKCISYKN